MPEFKRKIDKKLADEIERLEVTEPMGEPERRHRELELAILKKVKEWNEEG